MHYIKNNHEQCVTIFLGIITVLTGFSAFCGGLWNSASIANYSKSNANLTDANTTYLESVVLDQDLTEEDKKEYETRYTSEVNESQTLMQKADDANSVSDSFALVSVLYTIVLFLASITFVLKKDTVKLHLTYIAFLTSLLVTIRLLLLPFPFS